MKRILFVGTHNVIRSKYAEAYFNYMAEKKKIQSRVKLEDRVIAHSRGTHLVHGRMPRFRQGWCSDIKPKHYCPYAKKLQYNDLSVSDLVIGMYEPELRPQLLNEGSQYLTTKVKGHWAPDQCVDVEYWRVPGFLGNETFSDGNEFDDPRELLNNIEYNVELLIDRLDDYLDIVV